MPEMSSLEKVEVLKGALQFCMAAWRPEALSIWLPNNQSLILEEKYPYAAGSYNLYKPAFDIYGPLSSKIAVRLNGTYETAGSYRDEVHSKRYYINPSILFQINKKTTLLVQGDYLRHEFTPDFGIGSLDNTIIPKLPRSAFMGVSWQYNKASQATATAR